MTLQSAFKPTARRAHANCQDKARVARAKGLTLEREKVERPQIKDWLMHEILEQQANVVKKVCFSFPIFMLLL